MTHLPRRPRREPQGERQRREHLRQLSAASLGWNFALSPMVGLGLGYLLDRLLGTTPWLAGVFFVLGVAAAFINLFRYIR